MITAIGSALRRLADKLDPPKPVVIKPIVIDLRPRLQEEKRRLQEAVVQYSLQRKEQR